MKIINLPPKHLPTRPLTLTELEEDIKKRLSLISKEFTEGFEFIKNYPSSVTFFGSSQTGEGTKYYEKARSLATRIVKELGYSIVTGGGPGIMEAANRGAQEAGGVSIGLNIKLIHEQATNPYVTYSSQFYYFFVRKVCLSFSAETYIFFPGGFGTLDEMFEILTLIQTKKIEKVPIILFGKEYWGKLEGFIKEELLSSGLVDKEDFLLYTITEDEDEVMRRIKNTPVQDGVPFENRHTKQK
ncbi:MAG: TIGR00730 family Rossman fold protein [Patescibacteria group bacterium]